MNYSDNSLFGFYVISEPQNTGKVYKSSPFYVIMWLDYRSTILYLMCASCVLCMQLLQAVMHEFSSIAKGNVSDADLARAKSVAFGLYVVQYTLASVLSRNQLKASYLMAVERSLSLSDDIAAQVRPSLRPHCQMVHVRRNTSLSGFFERRIHTFDLH